MATPDEIFDEASGDVAVGDLDGAVEKYRRCVQLDANFFDGWRGPDKKLRRNAAAGTS